MSKGSGSGSKRKLVSARKKKRPSTSRPTLKRHRDLGPPTDRFDSSSTFADDIADEKSQQANDRQNQPIAWSKRIMLKNSGTIALSYRAVKTKHNGYRKVPRKKIW